ncbi:adenosine deaminase/editase [Dipodascopsis tothii]|uniref:adenosine deaminase/editase n=1 Tax=Dipodascopsis tothii TaxID=44089 RepID=UPI0034CECDF0
MALADRIARAALAEFDRCPKKTKPGIRSDGVAEWTNLAAVVVLDGDDAAPRITCAALATGLKVLPDAQLPDAAGLLLHDCHAEILAIRGFNRFLLDECAAAAAAGSAFVDLDPAAGRFRLRPCRLVLFQTEIACGDASMARLSDGQQPWDEANMAADGPLQGRGYFSQVGVVRTKPGRPDAPRTLSKSCTDKLTVRQHVSLLLTPLAGLVVPDNVYLAAVVVPRSQYDPESFGRAFGRAAAAAAAGPYRRRPFAFWTYDDAAAPFPYARAAVAARSAAAPKTSNVSLVRAGAATEAVIKGVKMGARPRHPKGASAVSRHWLFVDAVRLDRLLAARFGRPPAPTRYYAAKAADADRVAAKAAVHAALGSWTRTAVDDFAV